MKSKFPVILALLLAAAIPLAAQNRRPAPPTAPEPERLSPIGEAKGIHPGRVVWVHDPKATNWAGPGDGHWWEPQHTIQAEVSEMVSRALRELTGESTDAAAWDKLFRHYNQTHGRGDAGYKPGEKIAIKVNFVGMIRAGDKSVIPATYDLGTDPDYMNTSPQAMLAVLRQLVQVAGVKQADISLGDSLVRFANEFYKPLHDEFPDVRYLDGHGQFGRIEIKPSALPIYWSCRPEGMAQDYAPDFYAGATYLINLAALKGHTEAGVTMTAKNHYGSVIRYPVSKGYFNLHDGAFATKTKIYRPEVDLMGHASFGGKTFLYLIDGLYSGEHPIDPAPRKWKSAPFNGGWTNSFFASQDPVAIDSVGFDFLWTEYQDFPHRLGADDYLHEAALAEDPPSGTFYDPDHATSVKRLASLGVHEHWNSPAEKKYSRNLGKDKGIELVAVKLGESTTQP